MKTTLEILWDEYNLYNTFQKELFNRGYNLKDTYFIDTHLERLRDIIYHESILSLNDILRKTYFRLLVKIDKGFEYLPDIISNPRNWVVNTIIKDQDALNSDEVLIFSTESKCGVFSPVTRDSVKEYKYQDNKWQ